MEEMDGQNEVEQEGSALADSAPYVRAYTLSRLISGAVDGILVRIFSRAVFGIVFVVGGYASRSEVRYPLALSVAIFLIKEGYEVFMLGRYGKTIGDHFLKLRVVKLDGASIGYGTSLLRWLAKSWVLSGCSYLQYTGKMSMTTCESIVALYAIFLFFPVLSNKDDSQMFMDIFAGTKVEELANSSKARRHDQRDDHD